MVKILALLSLAVFSSASAQERLKPVTGAQWLAYSDLLQTGYVVGFLDNALSGNGGIPIKQSDRFVNCLVEAGFTNGTIQRAVAGLIQSDPTLLTKPVSAAIYLMLYRACGVVTP